MDTRPGPTQAARGTAHVTDAALLSLSLWMNVTKHRGEVIRVITNYFTPQSVCGPLHHVDPRCLIRGLGDVASCGPSLCGERMTNKQTGLFQGVKTR